MAIPQAKFREIVFQLLYSKDTGLTEEQSSISLYMKELQVARSAVCQSLIKASAIQQHIKEIDEMIARTSQSFTFDRIQLVERNILRLAVYEITIEKIIPPKVSITEAMRLGRKFATPEAANFINAILDAIYKKMIGEIPTLNEIENSLKEMEAKENYRDHEEICNE